jgi:hypothetical protein
VLLGNRGRVVVVVVVFVSLPRSSSRLLTRTDATAPPSLVFGGCIVVSRRRLSSSSSSSSSSSLSSSNYEMRLETDKLWRLQAVARATGADVCLSSDWRRTRDTSERVRSALDALGVAMVGETPIHAERWVRPLEITEWLDAFDARRAADGAKPVAAWVAVDDRALLSEPGGERLRGAPRAAARAVQRPPGSARCGVGCACLCVCWWFVGPLRSLAGDASSRGRMTLLHRR